MCKQWPCCDVPDYNIRRYDRAGNTLWDYHWHPPSNAPCGAADGPSNTTCVVGMKYAAGWSNTGQYSSAPQVSVPSGISLATLNDILCFDHDGEIIWQQNLAGQFETLGTSGQSGHIAGTPVQVVMNSSYEFVVAIQYVGQWFGTTGQPSAWLRFACVDAATGSVVRSSARVGQSGFFSYAALRPRAWVGGGVALSGDTMVLPMEGNYGYGTVAYDSVANSFAGSSLWSRQTAGIAEDHIFSYQYRGAGYEPILSVETPMAGVLSATYDPWSTSGMTVHAIPMGYLFDEYSGVNMLIGLGKWGWQTYPSVYKVPHTPSVGKISYSLGTITPPIVLKTTGLPHPSANPVVDRGATYTNEFVANASSTSSVDVSTGSPFARFEPDGTWLWFHAHGCKPHVIAENGDLIALGAGQRKNDRSFLAFP